MPLLTQIICVNLLLLNIFILVPPEVAVAQPVATSRKLPISEQSTRTTNDDHRDNSKLINRQNSQPTTMTVPYEYAHTLGATPTPTIPTPTRNTTQKQPQQPKHLMNNDHDHHPYDDDDTQLNANSAPHKPLKNYPQTFKMVPQRPVLRHRKLNPIQNDRVITSTAAAAAGGTSTNDDDDDYADAAADDDDTGKNDDATNANDEQLDNPLSRYYITKYLFMEFRAKNWSDRPLSELSPGGSGGAADPMHPMLPAPPTHMVPGGGGGHAPSTASSQQPFLFGVPVVVANGSSLVPMTSGGHGGGVGGGGGGVTTNGEVMANFTVNILPRPYFGDFFTAFQQSFQSIQVILSLIFCVIGIFANLTNVVVLTRPNMITAVNTILCAIACSDFIVNISNIPYLLHALFDQNTFGYFSYEWAVYTLMHAHVTVTAHTISIWLTCVLATWRYFVVCSKSANQRNWSVSLALRVIIIVVILVPIFCIPCYLSFMITSELRHQGDIMYSVGFTALAESSQFFRTFHFWMFSGLTKLLPCVLLTFFTTVLVRKLLDARERRLRLTSGNQSSGTNHAPSATSGPTASRASFAGARTATTNAAQVTSVSQQDRKCVANGRPAASHMMAPIMRRSLTSSVGVAGGGGGEEDDEKSDNNNEQQQSTVRVVANGQVEELSTTTQADEQPTTNKHLQLLARKESIRGHQRLGLMAPEHESNCLGGTDQQQQQQQPTTMTAKRQRRIAMLSSSSSTTTATKTGRAPIPMGPNSNSSCTTDAECLAVSCNGSSMDENSIDLHGGGGGGGGHLLVETTDSSGASTRTCSAPTNQHHRPHRQVTTSLSTNSASSINMGAPLTSPPPGGASLMATPPGGGGGGATHNSDTNANSRSASTCGALELYATIGDNQRTASSKLAPVAPGNELVPLQTLHTEPPLTRTSLAISAQDFTIQHRDSLINSPTSNKRLIRGVASSLSQSNLPIGNAAGHTHHPGGLGSGANGATGGGGGGGRNSIDPQITSPSAAANNRVRSVGSASFTPFNLVKLQATHRQLSQNETTTRLLIAVMVLFLVCEFPAGLLAALCAILGQEFFDNVYQPMGGITDLFALINSSINFVLYCFMSTQFRVTFYQVVLRCPAPNLPRTN